MIEEQEGINAKIEKTARADGYDPVDLRETFEQFAVYRERYERYSRVWEILFDEHKGWGR